MKALSLWQPWASLMADGRKMWETRHWPAPAWLIGQTYAIHAAMTVDRQACFEFGYDPAILPRGCIVSLHHLVECRRFTPANIVQIQDQYGDFTPGRYGWHSPRVEKLLKPVPMRGHQSIWIVHDPAAAGKIVPAR